ncbi:hypothetical protein E2C01_053504 [Portunus trituberculatus]|uniref:Uncharacterized protein n=1 Tax=Portunus trituberculatus TaxID=210409 RepID=A0A5B7GS96_PORTR|nr:hypothetical protein [Portunus trituberculatus]
MREEKQTVVVVVVVVVERMRRKEKERKRVSKEKQKWPINRKAIRLKGGHASVFYFTPLYEKTGEREEMLSINTIVSHCRRKH